jgi:hypothetical protein
LMLVSDALTRKNYPIMRVRFVYQRLTLYVIAVITETETTGDFMC